MPIRLLAIDIDGTLLTSERVPHPKNVEAIRRAREACVLVVLASGRVSRSIKVFAEELGLEGAMICCNGAHVQGPEGVEVLHLTLGQETIDRTLAYTSGCGVHTNAYTRGELFFITGDSEWGDVYRRRVRSVEPQIRTVENVRTLELLKLILIDHPSRIPEHRRHLESFLPPEMAFITESEPDYLEVLPPGANKGKGLEILAEAIGIKQCETAAIGDYLNDLEMIQWAGIGAAMGNAIPEVKAVADVQVGSNDDAGVAEFIDFILARNAAEAQA